MSFTIRCGLILALSSSAVLALCIQPAAAQGCPELLGLWPYGTAQAVAVSGSIAYVNSGTVLQVVDMNPSHPAAARGGDLVRHSIGIAVAGTTSTWPVATVVCG